jgi:hypothetical protein
MATDKIKAIQNQIVTRLEAGQDVSELSHQLAQENAKIVVLAQIEQLQGIADKRKALKDKAETVKGKVQKQGEAISRFLELRDSLVSQLQPLIEPMKNLAKMQTMQRDGPGECYAGYSDVSQFAGDVRGIPIDYLDKNFGCPFLTMKGGQIDARDKAREACNYLIWAVGILSSFEKSLSQVNLKEAEGLMAIDNKPIEPETGSCIICSHIHAERINNLLRQGKPLRDIEAEFAVSKSSLSRHKNRCLNLGAIRVEPESPAASANKTFFHG